MVKMTCAGMRISGVVTVSAANAHDKPNKVMIPSILIINLSVDRPCFASFA